MSVVFKDVPGTTVRDMLDALNALAGPGEQVTTGYGGVVVPEGLAYRFLHIAMGIDLWGPQRTAAPAPEPTRSEATRQPEQMAQRQEQVDVPPEPVAEPERRGSSRRRTTTKGRGGAA